MVEQYSDEWWQARLGKVTASRVADVVAKTKSGWGAGRSNYMAELIAERLTGTTAESYTNAAMQWGTDTEPQARAAYEFITGSTVELVGFVQHPDIEDSGASPDGLVFDPRVSEDGLIEIKCPTTKTHIDTLLTGKTPGKYVTQMQWQLACTGRAWVDFISFDPRLPTDLSIFQQRVDRDNNRIAELEKEVVDFLAELDDRLGKLHKLQEAA